MEFDGIQVSKEWTGPSNSNGNKTALDLHKHGSLDYLDLAATTTAIEKSQGSKMSQKSDQLLERTSEKSRLKAIGNFMIAAGKAVGKGTAYLVAGALTLIGGALSLPTTLAILIVRTLANLVGLVGGPRGAKAMDKASQYLMALATSPILLVIAGTTHAAGLLAGKKIAILLPLILVMSSLDAAASAFGKIAPKGGNPAITNNSLNQIDDL